MINKKIFLLYLRKFKRSRFKSHITGRGGENESVVDMNNIAFIINKYISVMSVFDLKKVTDNAVSSEWPDEVISCSLVVIFECFDIEFIKIFEIPDFFFDSINRLRIGQEFNDSGRDRGDNNFVGSKPDSSLFLFEDFFNFFNNLHHYKLLSQVISSLDDYASTLVAGKMAVRTFSFINFDFVSPLFSPRFNYSWEFSIFSIFGSLFSQIYFLF